MNLFQVVDSTNEPVAIFSKLSEAEGFMLENGYEDTGRHHVLKGISSVWSSGSSSAFIVRHALYGYESEELSESLPTFYN